MKEESSGKEKGEEEGNVGKKKEGKEGLRMIGIVVYDGGLCVNRGESALPLSGFPLKAPALSLPGSQKEDRGPSRVAKGLCVGVTKVRRGSHPVWPGSLWMTNVQENFQTSSHCVDGVQPTLHCF